ncbi:MAG: exonuclease SbcCD subunit D [Dehalococcoidales bacterium]|nr:exonuclease SbcCD subunit D [Dehalococcoidales bacterium]
MHFADLHLGVENYGRTDPATGLSSRLSDFLTALDRIVDYAIQNSVDLVLFCGDAYKAREPGQTQQREFAKRISRLSGAAIPTFLLIGNHDLPNAVGRATTTEIFDTLAIKNVYVSNHPEVCRIPTRSGIIQIASLPWLRRSAMLSKEEAKNLTLDQIRQRLQEALASVITSHVSKLDPALPAILAAHVWVTGAQVGSERLTTIGYEHGVMLSNIANPAFDYVALGHFHRHQVLSTNPPVVYSGSIERVDFSEETDEKGFCLVEIEPEGGKRKVTSTFLPLNGRRFLTINVKLEANDPSPTDAILKAIAAQTVDDTVVRLNISLPAGIENQLRDSELRNALKKAHYFTVARDIQREARSRLGKWTAEELTPLDALKAYLEAKKVPEERARVLLEYGAKLAEKQEQNE